MEEHNRTDNIDITENFDRNKLNKLKEEHLREKFSNVDVNDNKDIMDLISSRRELSNKLENDPEFREEYIKKEKEARYKKREEKRLKEKEAELLNQMLEEANKTDIKNTEPIECVKIENTEPIECEKNKKIETENYDNKIGKNSVVLNNCNNIHLHFN